MSPTPEHLVEQLKALGHARKSAREYYRELMRHKDDFLTAGSWCLLLDRREVQIEELDLLPTLSRFASVRQRAFPIVESLHERQLALAVANAPLEVSEHAAEQAVMDAKVARDDAALVAALREQFMATGRDDLLLDVVTVAERLGWEIALPHAVNAVLLRPHNPKMVAALLTLLQRAKRGDLIAKVIGYLAPARLHEQLVRLYLQPAKAQKR